MHKIWKWLLVISLLLVIAAISACDVVKPGKESEAEELLDEMFPTYTKTPTDTPEPTPSPTPEPTPEPKVSFVDEYGVEHGATIDQMIDRLDIPEDQKAQLLLAYLLDPSGDWIYSILDVEPGLKVGQVDQIGYGGIRMHYPPGFNDPPIVDLFPCEGPPPVEGWMTVCPQFPKPLYTENLHLYWQTFDSAIPLEDLDHYRTYGWVIDRDGKPTNNFQYQTPYNWDFYQDTDQWYQLKWVPNQATWSLGASHQGHGAMGSGARVVIAKNTIFLFLPGNEFEVETPGIRMTSFIHDGTYQPEVSGGDVSGDDPTQPLTVFESDPILMPIPGNVGIVLDDEYEICGSGLCRYNEKIVEQQKVMVWCTDAGCANMGGQCNLFAREIGDPPQEPDSWNHVAGPNQKMQKDQDFVYHCFCVK